MEEGTRFPVRSVERRYRIVKKTMDDLWIVQIGGHDQLAWTDVATFNDETDAQRYVQQVSARQRASRRTGRKHV